MLVSLAMSVALAAQSPAAEAPAPLTAEEEAAANKMICKKDNMIGSRVKKRRTCMTQREWLKAAQGARDDSQDLIDRATNVPAVDPSGG